MVGRYFMPHITLGVFKDDKNMVKAFNELQLKKHSFDVKSIFVCELGESHSCQRIIKKIDFYIDPEMESDEGIAVSNKIFNVIKKEYEKNLTVPVKKQSPQFFLCPVGVLGAGKTTVIKPLARKLSLVRISTDEVRMILKKKGYSFKRAREVAFDFIEKYARKSYSIAIDADCISSQKIEKIRKLAKEVKAKIIWIHINPPEKFIINKLMNLKYGKLFESADDAIESYYIRKQLHKKFNFSFLYTFDTSRKDLNKQINSAIAIIKKEIKN